MSSLVAVSAIQSNDDIVGGPSSTEKIVPRLRNRLMTLLSMLVSLFLLLCYLTDFREVIGPLMVALSHIVFFHDSFKSNLMYLCTHPMICFHGRSSGS